MFMMNVFAWCVMIVSYEGYVYFCTFKCILRQDYQFYLSPILFIDSFL